VKLGQFISGTQASPEGGTLRASDRKSSEETLDRIQMVPSRKNDAQPTLGSLAVHQKVGISHPVI